MASLLYGSGSGSRSACPAGPGPRLRRKARSSCSTEGQQGPRHHAGRWDQGPAREHLAMVRSLHDATCSAGAACSCPRRSSASTLSGAEWTVAVGLSAREVAGGIPRRVSRQASQSTDRLAKGRQGRRAQGGITKGSDVTPSGTPLRPTCSRGRVRHPDELQELLGHKSVATTMILHPRAEQRRPRES